MAQSSRSNQAFVVEPGGVCAGLSGMRGEDMPGGLVVEAVASSLVREFLYGKRLKRTSAVLEEELPRTSQSICNRNELRHALHLDPLYHDNKVNGKPFKTLLEIITNYFLQHFENPHRSRPSTTAQNPETPKMFAKGRQTRESESSLLDVYDLSDDDIGSSTAVSDTSKTESGRTENNVPIYKTNPRMASHRIDKNSESIKASRVLPPGSEAQHVKEPNKDLGIMSEPAAEVTNPSSETPRPKSSRNVRGMMTGPIASSQEESLKKRGRVRSASMTSSNQTKSNAQMTDPVGRSVVPSSGSTDPALRLGKEFSAKVLLASASSSSVDAASRSISARNPLSRQEQGRNGSVQSECGAGSAERGSGKVKSHFSAGDERQPGFSKHKDGGSSSRRKVASPCNHGTSQKDHTMQLDDVEDEFTCDVIRAIPVFPRSKVQLEGMPMDLPLAVGLKKLLFGSSLSCFSEEWKMQSFTFGNKSLIKYGFVQKKGGPCGVLAAVQACMLKHLLFIKDADSRSLHPSDTQRSACLCKAIADILWRAGGDTQAIVALSSGRQQFSPAGRYKADGILENLMLYNLQKHEDLVNFLQENTGQFEFGPFGCIILTVSVVLSRSIELVQQDFDVPTNSLIGAHAYCTQELVNLILGGRAVSNVFNDVMELDSGNGNVTVLKGIAQRSEIGFLSLFEHYSVCQVGSYLKTPKYPIWVVCSESHFSVLFCLRKELMNDWKIERKFDLHYYDGLANQQEEIRLTIDTAETYNEDAEGDLTPPLDYCIRTNACME
uniref:Ubiquitin carboxyl-terminal hydrolase MINDY n=1 Tax=Leptobrachium leishanense TaxID=445787 RepID=A0A8C5QWL5_9ANUR